MTRRRSAPPAPSPLVIVQDLATPAGGSCLVECTRCGRPADRVLAFGPAGQPGPTRDAHEHQFFPCGHRVSGPVLFDLRGRPADR